MSQMKVLFACGGTGGHINPAIAVAKMLKSRRPNAEILFAGAKHGMESKLVPAEGFELVCADVEGFMRKLTPHAIGHNLSAVKKVISSLSWAKKVVSDFEPDVVVGTGGYACFPVLYAASKKKIPTIIHEANAYPGLVTRTLAKRVSRVLVNFDATREYLSKNIDVITSGMPIREDMIYKDKEEARRELNLDEKPLVISFFGSLGAREMNKVMAEVIKLESEENLYNHIHAMGKFGAEWVPELITSKGVNLEEHKNIELREYIHDMPRVMAAADLVICRGGASTLSEISALGKPAIIVPSPNVAENHQEKNASVLENSGGAVMFRESEVSAEKMYSCIKEIVSDNERMKAMSRSLSKVAVLDGCERIYREITELTKN